MALSVRVFGLSSWSILVPQALMGVASVGLLHATVRRTTGSAAAGLIAGAVLALTPVAVLMFRFNNPDALLVLLLVGAVAYATLAARLRADGGPPVRWLALGGALVGFAFLTKMLQAFLVLPALALVYLLAAHDPGAASGSATCSSRSARWSLAAGWWIAIVELWPASRRPYIGGSQNNSILELTLGYNGFGRLTGNETGSRRRWRRRRRRHVGRDRHRCGCSTPRSAARSRGCCPAALILLGRRAVVHPTAPRTDLSAPALVVWGGWLLVTGADLQLHGRHLPRLLHGGAGPGDRRARRHRRAVLWQRRDVLRRRVGAGRHGRVHHGVRLRPARPHRRLRPWLQVGRRRRRRRRPPLLPGRRAGTCRAAVGLGVAGAALVAGLAGPAAYAVTTAGTPHTGSIPSAGPSSGGDSAAAASGRRGPRHAGRPAPRARRARRAAGTAGGAARGQHVHRRALTALLQTDADVLHLGGGRRRLQHRRRLPAGQRAAGDGDRRLQRQRPEPDAGAVPGSTSPTARSTTSSPAAAAAERRDAGGEHQHGDRHLGRRPLHRQTVDGVTLYDLSGGVQ